MEHIKIYNTGKWKRFRQSIMKRDRYLCQYHLRYGRSVPADVVHHIFPTDEYPELFFNPYNLISLSAKAHELMHHRDIKTITIEGQRLQEKVRQQVFEYQDKLMSNIDTDTNTD